LDLQTESLNPYHVMQPIGPALAVCFGCGYPLCETDYGDVQEFLPTDVGAAPDPRWVVYCDGCAMALSLGVEPEEFYMDRAA
jgi:hypothetical protein